MNYRESPYLVEVFDFDLLHLQLNTPLFIFVLVLVVMFFLQKWLFVPVFSTLDARRAKTDGWRSQAQAQRKEIAQITKTCEQRLTDMRKKNQIARHTQAKEITQETEKMLQKTRQQAEATFEKTVVTLGKEAELARENLAQTAETLADRLRGRLLDG